MSCPASVCNASMGVKDFGHIGLRVGNELLELGHLAHLLECKDLVLLVTVDSQTGRVVASVF